MCRLIVSLDLAQRKDILQLVNKLGDLVEYYKVGIAPFTSCGVSLIEELAKRGKKVFLDLKLFDIPHVVGQTITNLAHLNMELLTLHILGGYKMIASAVEARIKTSSRVKLLGVTILTSQEKSDWQTIGVDLETNQMVKTLACRGKEWGLDGVVCSPQELTLLRSLCPPPFLLVCPGIRAKKESDDQKRIASASLAASQGADFIVVGRPIYQALDPVSAVQDILKEIACEEKGMA